jgi:ubiquinone/menaquinone biosynthesis C-methylase UbiE
MGQQGQWQVAGSAPEVYQRELVPAVFGPWAPIVVELAHPRPGERVVDIACGTGIVARVAAARVGASGSVAGVDLNPGMLDVARSVAMTSQPAAPIQWHEGSADKLPFPEGLFDIAYCQLGLQFFADRPTALREMRRVLVAEGRGVVQHSRKSGICSARRDIRAKHWSSSSVDYASAIWII